MTTHFSAPDLAPEQAWFKSSYSDGTGTNCVEAAWIKSSYSDPGQNCVEVAHLTPTRAIAVRDSKNPTGPALLLPPPRRGRHSWPTSEKRGGSNPAPLVLLHAQQLTRMVLVRHARPPRQHPRPVRR
jgi:hypothetical protein